MIAELDDIVWSEDFTERTSPRDSDKESSLESSVISEDAFNRVARGPALPSASSANIKHFEKLAKSRVTRLKSPPRRPQSSRPQDKSQPLPPTDKIDSRQQQQQHDTSEAESFVLDTLSRRSLGREQYEDEFTWTDRISERSDGVHLDGLPRHDVEIHDELYEDWNEDEEVLSSMDLERTEFQRIAKHWSKMRDQRDVVKNTFDNIKSERGKLAELRHARDKADRALRMAILNILPDHPQLDNLFKASQIAGFNYRRVESHFDELIDDLEDNEIAMEIQERKFFTAVAQSDTSSDIGAPEQEAQPESHPDLRGIQADRPEDIHPLFEELRESSRELQLAKEFHMNLILKKRVLESKNDEEQTQDDKEFLTDYDGFQLKAHADMRRWTESAKKLETECRERGLIPKNTLFQPEGFIINPVFRDDIYLEEVSTVRCPTGTSQAISAKTLVHPRFTVILSNPKHLLEQFPQTAGQALQKATSLPPNVSPNPKFIEDARKERSIESLLVNVASRDIRKQLESFNASQQAGSATQPVHSIPGNADGAQSIPTESRNGVRMQFSLAELKAQDERIGDKTDYINRWLLHKLRISAMEAEILLGSFRSVLKILNMEQWQRDVLFFWPRDEAASLPTTQRKGIYEEPSSLAVNTADQESVRSLACSASKDSASVSQLS